MVPKEGVEPPRCFHQQALNLPRLPLRHLGKTFKNLANHRSRLARFDENGVVHGATQQDRAGRHPGDRLGHQTPSGGAGALPVLLTPLTSSRGSACPTGQLPRRRSFRASRSAPRSVVLGALGGIRTLTPFRGPPPQGGVSTSSTTRAKH